MRARRRTNLLWGIVLLGIALVLVLRALGFVPEGLFDLFRRAWPALLVLAGLSIVLRERVPLGSGIALVVTLALVVGVASVAFSTRSAQQRDDNQQIIAQPVGEDVSLLSVYVETLATDVELLRALDAEGGISGRFVGSVESQVQVDYVDEGDGSATFTLREVQLEPFPRLEAVGRGTLRLELPPELPLDVVVIGADGDVSLNVSGLAIERLNLNLRRGDAIVTLPEYDPLGSQDTDILGELAAHNGDITVRVPRAVAARFELNRGGSGILPQYDEAVYNYLVGDVLEARNIDSAEIVMRYIITAPAGRIRLETVAP